MKPSEPHKPHISDYLSRGPDSFFRPLTKEDEVGRAFYEKRLNHNLYSGRLNEQGLHDHIELLHAEAKQKKWSAMAINVQKIKVFATVIACGNVSVEAQALEYLRKSTSDLFRNDTQGLGQRELLSWSYVVSAWEKLLTPLAFDNIIGMTRDEVMLYAFIRSKHDGVKGILQVSADLNIAASRALDSANDALKDNARKKQTLAGTIWKRFYPDLVAYDAKDAAQFAWDTAQNTELDSFADAVTKGFVDSLEKWIKSDKDAAIQYAQKKAVAIRLMKRWDVPTPAAIPLLEMCLNSWCQRHDVQIKFIPDAEVVVPLFGDRGALRPKHPLRHLVDEPNVQ